MAISPAIIGALGAAKTSFETSVRNLFANNEQGFFYDPNDLSTMFQDAAGTIPVTAAGQPVMLIRDKSGRNNHAIQPTSSRRPIFQQTPILGNELMVNGDTSNGTDGWVNTNATLNIKDGAYVMVASSRHGGVTKYISLDTTKTYELTFTVIGNTTNALLSAIIRPASTTTNYATVTITTAGKYKTIFKPTAASSRFMFQHSNTAPTGSLTFDNVSIKEITGYLADQNHIKYDGVDDKLLTNLPAQLTGCTVIRSVLNVGTQILTNQTVPPLYNDNIDNCGLIVIDRALTPSETSAITAEFNKRAGV